MVGITRIGAYFPRRRLDRALIAKAWGVRVPPGARPVAGFDEDALTMAADAVLACLGDADPAGFDALYFASTSSPYLEKQVASMIATAADLRRDLVVADLAGSVRAGLAALRAALDGVRAGSLRTALVAAADARLAEPESEMEPLLGDGAAAVAVGGDGVLAELVSAASVAEEFTYVWRTDEQRTLRVSETRFGTSHGYVRDMAEAIGAALRKAELPPARVARRAAVRADGRARHGDDRVEGAQAGHAALRQPLRGVRSRPVPAGARLHRLPGARPHAGPQAPQARQRLHLHHRQPGAGAGASHADGRHRPGRRRPRLSPGDRRGRGRGEGGRAGRAHLPAFARGGRESQLLLEGAPGADMMKDQVAVVGVGCTKFGDRYERSFEELICDAAFEAYADAGIEPDEIEAAYLGTYLPGPGGGKAAVSLADALRLYDRPITRVENYCATGTDAFRNGCLAVAAGAHDVVLVLGAEKLKDRGGRGIPRLGHPLLARGNTAPGLFALAANRYMHTFGLGRETLAKVAVKNHRNGARNEKAHLRMEVTEEQVLKAPIIAWPFR